MAYKTRIAELMDRGPNNFEEAITLKREFTMVCSQLVMETHPERVLQLMQWVRTLAGWASRWAELTRQETERRKRDMLAAWKDPKDGT